MAIRENYSHAIADKKKEQKRKDALRRKELRGKRTDEQQLLLLKARRGKSVREVK